MPTMSAKSRRMPTKNEQSALAIFAMMCRMSSLPISWIVLLMRRTSVSVSHQPRKTATAKRAQRANRLRCALSCLVPASALVQTQPSVPVTAIVSTAAIERMHAGRSQAVSGQAIRLACGAKHNWGGFGSEVLYHVRRCKLCVQSKELGGGRSNGTAWQKRLLQIGFE